jgi:hypothetical protein
MRVCAMIGACLGWFALLLQLCLMLGRSPLGVGWFGTIVTFVSFFTILTNTVVALVFTAVGFQPSAAWGQFFRRPSVQASAVVYITVVGVVYWQLLKHLWDPQGAQWLADTLLHTILPLLYVLYWLLFAPKGGLRRLDAVVWLVYPGVYLVYTLARGAISGVYPYPFVDVKELGFTRVLGNSGGLLLVFLGLGMAVVALGKKMDRERSSVLLGKAR